MAAETNTTRCIDMSSFIPGTYHAIDYVAPAPEPNSAPTITHNPVRRTASGRIIRTGFKNNECSVDFSGAENRTTLSVTIPGKRTRKFSADEKITYARQNSRRDAADYIQEIPEHRQVMADIAALGETIEGLSAYMGDKIHPVFGWGRGGCTTLTRQLVEDCHIGPTGDVMRDTCIDRDPRPRHRKPVDIMRGWKVDGPTAERIAAAIRTLGIDARTANALRIEHTTDAGTLGRLFKLADEIAAVDTMPETDALSTASRYYEDSEPDDDGEILEVDGDVSVNYQGADRGFSQYVNLDDTADGDPRHTVFIQGESVQVIDKTHPACPWSLKQPESVQKLGKALRTATTPDMLKAACTTLIESASTMTPVQKSVLWGIYFRTKERIHIRKYGVPTPQAMRYKARLTGGGTPVNFGAAAVAIQHLSPGDRQYLRPILYSARMKAQKAAATA